MFWWHSAGWRLLLWRTMALVALYVSNATSLSAQVVLLVERDASTYQQAAQGFRNAFADALNLEEIELDESGRLPRSLVEGLRRNPPQLMVAIGTRAARAATERPPRVPVLYCLTLRPQENRLVGTNIGGMVLDVDIPRQLEHIRKLLPGLRRIGMVYDELTSGQTVMEAKQYLGPVIQVVPRNARTPQEAAQEIRDLFDNVLGPGDAFWMLWDSVTANPANFRTLVELSLKTKVSLIVPARPFVEAGALISVGANYEMAGRQLAQMARLILSGQARPTS